MRVPVTDAFDETEQLESLTADLKPEQIEWLKKKAAERGLSVDHMLRTIITAQMRDAEKDGSSPPVSGDGARQSVPSRPSAETSSDTDTEPTSSTHSDDSGAPSIVESLRSASERLQDLTEDTDNEAEKPGLHDTLARLQSHVNTTTSAEDDEADENPQTVLTDQPNQSMFDMVD